MSINHHPTDTLLAAYTAGTLDHGQHIAMATHLAGCAACRKSVREFEQVGGVILGDLPPAAMSADALTKIEARLVAPVIPARVPELTVPESDLPGLPRFVRGYRFQDWKWIAPGLHMRPIVLPHVSDTQVFLLKAKPGMRLLEHSHTGVEMTCILSGSYSQSGTRYGVGDFDFGDDEVSHQPLVDPGEECICLIAMQGKLKLGGILGRIMQPFIPL